MNKTKAELGEIVCATLSLARLKGCMDIEIQSPEFCEYRTGYSSEDITGFYIPDSIQEYFAVNSIQYLESLSEFGWIKSIKLLPLSLPWSQWVWTLNSTQYLAQEIAKQRIRDSKTQTTPGEIEHLASTLTDEEIYTYLNENYTKHGNNIWVNRDDCTVFYYDYKAKPYKLTDGWSKRQVEEIMGEWLHYVVQEYLPVKIKSK